MITKFTLINTSKPVQVNSIVKRESDDQLAIVNCLTIDDPNQHEHKHVEIYLEYNGELIATNNPDSTLFKINDSTIKEFINNYNSGEKTNYAIVDRLYADEDEIKVSLLNKKYSLSEMKEYFLDVMNLGMSHRQDQLSNYSDKSGNEILENWFNEKFTDGKVGINTKDKPLSKINWEGHDYFDVINFDGINVHLKTTPDGGSYFTHMAISELEYREKHRTKAGVRIDETEKYTIFNIFDDYGSKSVMKLHNSLSDIIEKARFNVIKEKLLLT